jgi:hypothetical protein
LTVVRDKWPIVRRRTLQAEHRRHRYELEKWRRQWERNNKTALQQEQKSCAAKVEREHQLAEKVAARLLRVRLTKDSETDVLRRAFRIHADVAIDTFLFQNGLYPNGPERDYIIRRLLHGLERYLNTIDFAAVPYARELMEHHPLKYWREPVVSCDKLIHERVKP